MCYNLKFEVKCGLMIKLNFIMDILWNKILYLSAALSVLLRPLPAQTCDAGMLQMESKYTNNDFTVAFTDTSLDPTSVLAGSGQQLIVSKIEKYTMTHPNPTMTFQFISMNLQTKDASVITVRLYKQGGDPNAPKILTGFSSDTAKFVITTIMDPSKTTNIEKIEVSFIVTSGSTVGIKDIDVSACTVNQNCFYAGDGIDHFEISLYNPSSIKEPPDPYKLLRGTGGRFLLYDYTVVIKLKGGGLFTANELVFDAISLSVGTINAFNQDGANVYSGTFTTTGGPEPKRYVHSTDIPNVKELNIDLTPLSGWPSASMENLYIDACPPTPTTETTVITEGQSTMKETTELPTTKSLTTELPTTEPVTTESLTTEPETTESPTTESLTTESPTTESPTTESHTTLLPTAESTTTEPHTTLLPTTESTIETQKMTTVPQTTTTESQAITTTGYSMANSDSTIPPEVITTAHLTTPGRNEVCQSGLATLYAKYDDVDFDIYMDNNAAAIDPRLALQGSSAYITINNNNTYHVNKSILGVPYFLMEVRLEIRGADSLISGALNYVGYISEFFSIGAPSQWTSIKLKIEDGGFPDIHELTLEYYSSAGTVDIGNIYVLGCKAP